MSVLLMLLIMWGAVAAIYTVLFFPEIEEAAKRAAHRIEAKIAAHRDTHPRHHPPFPRPA